MHRNTRSTNAPSSICRSRGRALSGSSKARNAPVYVPSAPRHRTACSSFSFSASTRSFSFAVFKAEALFTARSSSSRRVAWDGMDPSVASACPAERARRGSSRSETAADEHEVSYGLFSLSRRASFSHIANTSRTSPSHRACFTTLITGSYFPSFSSSGCLKSGSSRYDSSSSRGSLADAAMERLWMSRAASSPAYARETQKLSFAVSVRFCDAFGSRSSPETTSGALFRSSFVGICRISSAAAWRRKRAAPRITASAHACCRMTRQCLSRRWDMCARGSRNSSGNDANAAESGDVTPFPCAAAVCSSHSISRGGDAASASDEDAPRSEMVRRISSRRARVAVSSASVSSESSASPSGSELSARFAAPSAVASTAAAAAAVSRASTSAADRRSSSPAPGGPALASGAETAAAGSRKNGRSKRFATQQNSAHADDAIGSAPARDAPPVLPRAEGPTPSTAVGQIITVSVFRRAPGRDVGNRLTAERFFSSLSQSTRSQPPSALLPLDASSR